MSENDRPTAADSAERAAPPIDANLRSGLTLLAHANRYALDACAAPWDFALENEYLYEAALTISDLRWLVAKGLAEHGQEMSLYGDPHRSFRLSSGFNFVPTTCFILTQKGIDFAATALKETASAD